MGEFGWAYISGSAPVQSAGGVSGSVQFATDSGNIDGSSNFLYKNEIGSLLLTGSVNVSGSIIVQGSVTASNFVIENVTMIDVTGSSVFGNSPDDTHEFTGSVYVSNITGSGHVSASAFLGDGSALTGITFHAPSSPGQYRILTNGANASDVQAESKLTWKNDWLSVTGSYTSSYSVKVATLSGSGTDVYALNASNISAGTLNNSRLPTTISVTAVTASGHVSASAFLGDGSALTGITSVAIGNDGANRFVLSDGDGTFTAQPNLTYDGTTFIINDDTIVTGSLTVSGSIYANEFITNVVSKSVIHISSTGSTTMGDSSDDIHLFTGTIHVTGAVSASTDISASSFIGDGSSLTGLDVAVNTYNSAAQYRLLASVDSSTIQGESKLTWKNDWLSVTGSITSSYSVKVETLSGSGADVYALNASNIAAGTLNDSRISSTFASGSTVDTNAINIASNASDLNLRLNLTGGTVTFLTASGHISASAFLGDGSALTGIVGGGGSGTLGAAEDGSYTDGLFVDFTTSTPVGTAVDRFNEVLKALAPSPAPVLDDVDCDDSGASGKLSFGAAGAVSGYTNVGTAAGFSAVDVNGSYTVTSANNNLRRGLFNGTVTINGDLNDDISSDGSYPNYPARSFGNADQGTLKLEVNGAVIAGCTINLTHAATGSGVPGSGTGDYLENATGSGFHDLSQTASAHFTDGTELDVFQHRTGKWQVHPDNQRDGWNYARVIHTIGSDTETNYVEWVNDSNSNALAESNAAFGSLSMTGLTSSSGVKYFTGGTAIYTVDVDHAYKNTYSTSNISWPTTTNCSISSIAMPAIGGGEDETKSLAITGSATINVSILLAGDIATKARIYHPLKSTKTTTLRTISNILLYTYSDNSTVLNETFRGENYRLDSGSYANQSNAVSGNEWDTTTSLTTIDGLMFYNQALRSPLQGANSGNFSTIANGPGSNVNYSSITGTRTFYRKFKNTSGGSKTGFDLNIQGGGTTIVPFGGTLSATNIKVFIKLPNTSNSQTTGWMDLATAFSTGQTGDNDGCLEGSLDNSLNAENTITFGTVYVGDDDWIVVKIEANHAWTGNISTMTADWT